MKFYDHTLSIFSVCRQPSSQVLSGTEILKLRSATPHISPSFHCRSAGTDLPLSPPAAAGIQAADKRAADTAAADIAAVADRAAAADTRAADRLYFDCFGCFGCFDYFPFLFPSLCIANTLLDYPSY